MNTLKSVLLISGIGFFSSVAHAHFPFVAPLNYQTFNNHTAILSGFYDNPFASEVAIKNFKFHFHTPTGQKVHLIDQDWTKTQTVSSYSLENKIDGTYRLRGEKEGTTSRFALVSKEWKPLVGTAAKSATATPNDKVVYASQLKKNTAVKTVQNLEIIETFVSRRSTNDHVIKHIHGGFDIQFLTHPNAIKVNQPIQFKILDDKQGVANLKVELLTQTTDFSREEKVYQTEKTNDSGELNFKIAEKGQYLLKVDYQQPFTAKSDQLKRYKYTLAFNVID